MREKKIYLLLTDTGTLFTRLIKVYTKKPYNHASIAFDEELSTVYSFGRKNPRNPLIGGFVCEDIYSRLFMQADCAIYSLSVREEQFYKLKSCIQEIAAQKERYHYNLLGIFGVMLNKPIKRKNAFFCSQFVASILKQGDLIRPEKDLSLIQPHDLPFLADFQLVYEGRVKDYSHKIMGERVAIPQ